MRGSGAVCAARTFELRAGVAVWRRQWPSQWPRNSINIDRFGEGGVGWGGGHNQKTKARMGRPRVSGQRGHFFEGRVGAGCVWRRPA